MTPAALRHRRGSLRPPDPRRCPYRKRRAYTMPPVFFGTPTPNRSLAGVAPAPKALIRVGVPEATAGVALNRPTRHAEEAGGRGSRGIGRGGLPDHGRLAAWTGKRSDTFLRWSRATGPARCRPQKSSSRRLAIDCEEPSRLGGRTPPFYAISATKTVMSSACGALATKVVISLSSSTTRSLAFFMHRG